jgi:DNA polymerase-3 subunit delta
MDLATFEKQISEGKLSQPVYIFAGPEDFLKERAFQKILDRLVPEADQTENVFRMDCSGKATDLSEHEIFSFSFNPSPRFFFFQHINSVNAGSRKKFIGQISQSGVPANTYLIFTTSDAKVAGEISTAFKQQSEKIDFWRPFENQLPAWVKKEAAELGGKISSDATELLIDLTGSNLAILYQELKKLVIANPKKTIEKNLVKEAVRYLRQDSVFDFLESFGNRKLKDALRTIEILVNSGEASQKIWFLLCRQLREFRLLHELIIDRPDLFSEIESSLQQYAKVASKSDFRSNQEKKSLVARIQNTAETMPPALASSLGFNNPVKIKHLHMALNFSYSSLVKVWPKLIETDLKFKSGVPDPKTALQNFVCDFLSKPA